MPTTNLPRPHPNCYWVQPGRFLAGEYPGDWTPTAARQKLRLLLEAGVTFFLDLTHPTDPLEPYTELLQEEAQQSPRPVCYQRMAILDRSVPPVAQMVQILDVIDEALTADHVVYVHCWGGVGRTGTVVGCHLVRQGHSGDDALATLARLWQTVEKRNRYPQSPETPAQVAMVRTWQAAVSVTQSTHKGEA